YVLKSNLTRLAPAALRAVEGAELRRKQRRSAEAARLALFAVDHASLSIMTVAADGAIVYVNGFACDELGARREDLLGAKLWEYDQNASAATWSERWEAFRQSRVLEFERDSVRSDGRRRITDVTANYLEGADCLISYGRDITDKRLAEERAKASEQRYERLADNAPDIIFRYDFIPTMGLTYINPAVETITGYSPEECYADPQLMLTMVHPDDAAPMAALVQSLTPPDEPLLMRWIGKDGVSRWMESHIVPVRDTEGRLLAVEGITREVTERVEAEEALRRREREFSTLVENAPDMIVRFDTDLRYVYCNAVVAGQLGVPAQMLIGKTPLETGYPREQAEVVHQALRQALETGAEQIVEQSLPTPSGHRHFATRVVPERDEQGSIGSLLAITRDITERKQAEEALTHSRDLMRYIIEHNQSAVAVHDRDLKYIYVSERYLHDYGVKEHDVIGKGHYEVFPDLPQKWRDVHRKALAGEISSAEDDPYVRSDGAVEWTRWECRPWFEADGSIGGIIVYTEVVTARKRVDEALRVSEERNRAILQTAMDGFWLVDTDGRLLEVNETYCRMSGYSAPELLAMRIPDLEAAEAGADTVAHIERIMAQGEDRFESRHRRKDGSLFDIEASAQFRPGEGGRFVVFLRDITERKRAEEELAQSHDLLSNLARLVPGVVYQYRLYPDGSSAFPYSSPGMNDIYECTPEEVREDATPVFGRLHPDDYDRVADAIQESASTLNEFYCEFRVILPRQGLRWRWSQAHPERTEDGGTLWHGIISDITERKLAEDALRESEERFEGFAEHFPGYLFMQDEERRYVYVNRPEEKHGDVRREDWFGKTPSQVWGDDGAARAEDRVQRALDGEVVDVVEPWMPPGLHEYLHTVYFPIPRADKPPLVGGISIDVTAQVAAE
ncbi:MAG: PAS domain S-box protein, partial [Actinomycetes bacterium]